MAHYKPKTITPVYSEARLVLLREPWLRYKEVHAKMAQTCNSSSVETYGASIRHEIGCELRSIGGKEVMEVDYSKYTAACAKYAVRPLTLKTLLKASSPKRQIVAKPEQLPPPPEEIIVPQMVSGEDAQAVVDQMTATLQELMSSQAAPETINLPPYQVIVESFSLGGDIKAKKAKLTKSFEEAELRMSDASRTAKYLEALRKDLLAQVAELDDKIAAQRQAIDEANQAMEVMLALVDAPDAVIDLVL